MFFVLKLMASATHYRTIVLITNSIKICIIYHLSEAQFHVDYSGGNYTTFENRLYMLLASSYSVTYLFIYLFISHVCCTLSCQ